MSHQRRFRDKIGLLKSRILSRSDPRHQNSNTPTPSTVLDSSHPNVPPNADSGLEPSSSANDSYGALVPEALTLRNKHASGSQLKEMGWNALETALSAVNGASGAFPPLQAAVGGLLGLMKQIDNVKDVHSDFLDIARTIDGLQSLLGLYESRTSLPEGVKRQLEHLSSAINDLKLSIDDKIKRGLVRRTIDASNDARDIVKAFRTIANLVSICTMDTAFRIQSNTEDIHKVVIEAAHNDLLKALQHVPEAAFNAGDRRGCLQGTRVKLLEGLLAWAADDGSQRVYWLSGMAGTGKTAIAYTFSRLLASKKSLAAAFFCSRSAKCTDVRRIFPTIAWRMARTYSSYRAALLEALKSDVDAQAGSLEDQFQTLLLGPLQSTNPTSTPTGIIIIDALDECDSDEATENLLHIILKHASKLPIKIFISSRPEPQIRDLLVADTQLCSLLKLHDVEDDVIRDDIRLYIITSLAAIFQDRRSDFDSTGEDWPPTSQIDVLVKHAGKLFIYAFTICKYIGERRASPKRRLLNVTTSRSLSNLATAHIDDIYRLILGQLPDFLDDQELSITKQVLDAVICVRIPLSVDDLGSVLGFSGSDIRSAVAALHSLMLIPPINHDIPVSIFHASFADYLMDPSRSKDWVVDVGDGHNRLTHECLRIMTTKLVFNITQLDTSYLRNVDMGKCFTKTLPRDLTYACQFWPDHLINSRSQDLLSPTENLLRDKFLFWLEVLSVLGLADSASGLLVRLSASCLNISGVAPTLAEFLKDCNEFVIEFQTPISCSAPHVYLSALSFVRSDSLVSTTFRHRFSLISIDTCVQERPQLPILKLKGHGGWVNSVAFSHDKTRIVSGSEDNTIRVWDAETGQAISEPFSGHEERVNSVAFSYDGKRIVSGSHDKTIRIWDAETGRAISKPILGHEGRVNSVAFSHDGKHIVSASHDETIRVWDAETGRAILKPFSGHERRVNSVAFSHDGKRIVSASHDKTVRVWDAKTGHAISKPTFGHEGAVSSIAFSHDGKRIVSGSHDYTIRVWDAETGQAISKPILGHENWVNSVAFSHDGKRIVSCSNDKTIRVWDAETGQPISQRISAHEERVNSVAFSDDGKHIVSGSHDKTIRVWDAKAGLTISKPISGHERAINSVTFSHDGKRIVSGSNDMTIRVWDAETGLAISKPISGHEERINSVAFSYDGKRIVSGSRDKTIRIWDAETGQAISKPISGHESEVNSIAFSHDGKHVVSCSNDKTIRVWDAETGQPISQPISGHEQWVNSAAFSHDGKRIVSGSDDMTIRVWDAETGQAISNLYPISGHEGWVNSVAFSRDGKHILSGSEDNTIRVWCAETGQTTSMPILGHEGAVNSVAFSPNGSRIVSGSDDNTLRVWDAETGQAISTPFLGHEGAVNSVDFSHDGKRIVSGSNDKTIRVWDAENGRAISTPISGHGNSFNSIAAPSVATFQPMEMAFSSKLEHSFRAHPSLGAGLHSSDAFRIRDGWILGPQDELLFWVPPEHRLGLWWPRTLAIIGSPYTRLDLSQFKHGQAWTACYFSD